jgi:poly(3-hydroxybutyrate) depolymerase
MAAEGEQGRVVAVIERLEGGVVAAPHQRGQALVVESPDSVPRELQRMGDALAATQIPNLAVNRRVFPPMYAKLTLAALAAGALVAPSPAGAAYQAGANHRTVELDGIDRRYVVYVPRNVNRPAPVVLMFHGSSGTGEQFLRTSGWRELADREGFVAVFPTGLRYRVLDSGRRVTKWNDFALAGEVDLSELPPGYPEGSPMPANDVGFVDLILADLHAGLPIDHRRVYASGFSNGANFAARLSVDRATRIAAAAYSGGGLPEAQPIERPVPTYVTVGSLDDRVLEGTGLAELPLDPVEILSSPVLDPFIDAHLETFGLDEDDFGAVPAHDQPALAGRRHRPARRAVPLRHDRRRRAPLPRPAGARVLALLHAGGTRPSMTCRYGCMPSRS